MPSYSSKRYQEEYELSIDTEFEFDGRTAEWAPGRSGPRFWDNEDDLIQPGEKDPDERRRSRENTTAALSADGRFLAVAMNKVIEIYEIETLALCSKLVGSEHAIGKLIFVNAPEGHGLAYRLFAQESDYETDTNRIIVWHLDVDGALQREQRIKPLPVDVLTDGALKAVTDALDETQSLSDDVMTALREGFLNALNVADAQHRIKNIPKLEGSFSGFSSGIVSPDGRKLLRILHGTTTQHGMRPAEELPQIAVTDIATNQEIARLKGHTDAIMWSGWSLDNVHVATAAWDSSYRIFNAETGECIHEIRRDQGQCWKGGILADGKHVILSGGQPVEVGVYDIPTAEKVTKLEPVEGKKLDHWMRYFVCHPSKNLVVLQNGQTLIAWRPATPASQSEGAETQIIFSFTDDGDRLRGRFNSIYYLRWVDEGKKLLASGTEGTTYVWDMEKNLKWRFQRQKGRDMPLGQGKAFFVRREGTEWVAVLDGDAKLRFWKL